MFVSQFFDPFTKKTLYSNLFFSYFLFKCRPRYNACLANVACFRKSCVPYPRRLWTESILPCTIPNLPEAPSNIKVDFNGCTLWKCIFPLRLLFTHWLYLIVTVFGLYYTAIHVPGEPFFFGSFTFNWLKLKFLVKRYLILLYLFRVYLSELNLESDWGSIRLCGQRWWFPRVPVSRFSEFSVDFIKFLKTPGFPTFQDLRTPHERKQRSKSEKSTTLKRPLVIGYFNSRRWLVGRYQPR